jgi:hypothetical protein
VGNRNQRRSGKSSSRPQSNLTRKQRSAAGPGESRGSGYRSRRARSLPIIPIAVAAALVLIGVGIFFYARSTSGGSQPQAQSQAGHTVDGIQCQQSEQLAYHIHSHLAIYADGNQRPVNQGIGIAPPQQTQQTQQGTFVTGGSCLYWLHTHDSSGIIHVESPTQKTYTLGNFFDIWGQTLSPQQVGSSKGAVVAYVNGQPYSGNPRNIQLNNHQVIQLDVGQPATPAQPYTFPADV